MGIDYSTVTEVPGNKITQEQLERAYNRYRFASEFCKDKDVLEVGCGPGIGLGYLAKNAKKVIGGDYTEYLLNTANEYYKGRINLLRLDAHKLPFKENSFDVVIFYEAIYYLESPDEFVRECIRILRNNGFIIICTVNKDWSDFNPSPFSFKYFSAPELYTWLSQYGSNVKIFGNCFVEADSPKDKIISIIKRTAVALHLMPKTMRIKQIFKRFFFGKLIILKGELTDGMVDYSSPVLIAHDIPNPSYKVLFATTNISKKE